LMIRARSPSCARSTRSGVPRSAPTAGGAAGHGVRYLTQAIRWTHELGASIINTDEGVKADFTDVETDHILAKYTLTKVAREASGAGC